MHDDKKTRAIFAITMYGVAEDFGGTVSDNNLAIRFDALREYSIEQITRAGTWLLKNRLEKFPAVPTTREFINAIKKQSGEVEHNTAGELQCDIVMKYFRHYGRNCEHKFKDQTTRYLMENRWSFAKLGSMNEADLKWFRKEFVDAYKNLKTANIGFIAIDEKISDPVPAGNLKLLTDIKSVGK